MSHKNSLKKFTKHINLGTNSQSWTWGKHVDTGLEVATSRRIFIFNINTPSTTSSFIFSLTRLLTPPPPIYFRQWNKQNNCKIMTEHRKATRLPVPEKPYGSMNRSPRLCNNWILQILQWWCHSLSTYSSVVFSLFCSSIISGPKIRIILRSSEINPNTKWDTVYR